MMTRDNSISSWSGNRKCRHFSCLLSLKEICRPHKNSFHENHSWKNICFYSMRWWNNWEKEKVWVCVRDAFGCVRRAYLDEFIIDMAPIKTDMTSPILLGNGVPASPKIFNFEWRVPCVYFPQNKLEIWRSEMLKRTRFPLVDVMIYRKIEIFT